MLFSSLCALEFYRGVHWIGSDFDLYFFITRAVLIHVSDIVKKLYKDPILREAFGLKGSIQFENHVDTLCPEQEFEVAEQVIEEEEQEIEDSLLHLDLNPRPTALRRSQRLADREQSESRVTATLPPMTPLLSAISRPDAYQFCVYNAPNEVSETSRRVAAYIQELKCPNEVTLGHIYGGLEDMDVDQVVRRKAKETKEDLLHRLIAGILTQTFDYMVRAGTKRAVFSTGEADIYLRIDEDPSTLYYHLSIPKGDVGDTTGWDSSSDSSNRLHLTAVGQALAFTLQALKLRPQSQAWRERAAISLPKWKYSVADILRTISEDDIPSSEYRPSRPNFTQMSPIRLRQIPPEKAISSCQSSQMLASSDEDDSVSPNTHSQSPPGAEKNREATTTHIRSTSGGAAGTSSSSQEKENNRSYCTLACLLEFLDLLRRQLDQTVNADCESLGIHGARGALLKVSLSSHGYTAPAKCTTAQFAKYLKHEALVYKRLLPLQGINVPLCLGIIDLAHPYSYEGICYLEHMLILGPGGQSLRRVLTPENEASMSTKTEESLSAVHRLGVLHRDAEIRNLLYNSETDNVVILDFERAEILERHPAIGFIPPMQECRRRFNLRKSKEALENAFAGEMRVALRDVRCPKRR
ncbi:uncharacterized protein N7515_000084 [Penicillium bovifimosum]|uniref:Protein kinase domain-containing protein n=1 Tax=Penicillium bovifimosum TaxID=126998 RepID=A0A9W9HER8_9EURO|nr:uncharacterized protein N7515_000084 [Penicillium bovifimosum]KAJ5145520.1 hypothetical protein N7515_000084 [Penicillium bovifimosum]